MYSLWFHNDVSRVFLFEFCKDCILERCSPDYLSWEDNVLSPPSQCPLLLELHFTFFRLGLPAKKSFSNLDSFLCHRVLHEDRLKSVPRRPIPHFEAPPGDHLRKSALSKQRDHSTGSVLFLCQAVRSMEAGGSKPSGIRCHDAENGL